MSGRVRALAEALRAPLLLSPLADVACGWIVASAARGQTGAGAAWRSVDGTRLAAAALAGVCLLAAGMAQNAWLDLEDDRRHKPERPLPRGALSVSVVRGTCLALSAVALSLATWQRPLLPAVGWIVVVSAAYHLGLKRARVPGCLALGSLRAACMSLGVLAVAPFAGHGGDVLAVTLYGLYITGASLHASVDDQPEPGHWSGLGLATCVLVLLVLPAWAPAAASGLMGGDPGTGAEIAARCVPTLVLAGWGVWRLAHSRRHHPPPRTTGVALSGLHVFHATLVAALGAPLIAVAVLGLYVVSRRLLRSFPPS